MNMKFVRLTQGLTNHHAAMVPIAEIKQGILDRVKRNKKQDYYVSLYRYSDHHVTHFEKNNEVKGITDVTTPKILFDFDNKTDIERARKDALTACARLVDAGVPEDKLRIYFSGNKGFGVEVLTTENMTRQEFVNVVFNLAGDLPTFDVKINDENRIIRAPFSQHPESKLYKIPIALSELASLSIKEIKNFASDISLDEDSVFTLDDANYQIEMPEKIKALKTKTYKKIGKVEIPVSELKFDTSDIDFSQCPKWLAKERYALQEGFFYGSENVAKGERNTAFMILAATYKNQGFSADHTLSLLMTTSEKQAARTKEDPYTEEQMKREIINTVFHTGWKGGIYSQDEELLQLTRARFNLQETISMTNLVDISDVGNEFKEFARTIDRNTIKTGLKSLDDQVQITSGMMVSLLASPGCGKTSFANKFVEHLSQSGENTIYFSLDMYKNLLFTRLLQKYSGYDMSKIFQMFKNDEPDKILYDAYSQVLKNYNNTYFNFKSGPTVEEIEAEIIAYQQEKGVGVKLVVIDYLEKVRGPFADSTANSAYVASRLSDIAKRHHTTVLLLVQPQKSAGDPRDELISYRKIKGASVIEQDSRVILTMSRPGYNPKDSSDDKYMSISVVKNNMGGLAQVDFAWDGVKGDVIELSTESRRELIALRKRLAEEKDTSTSQYNFIS